MSSLYKINEIFLSIQGEGSHIGRLAIFVRFSGCNLACSFCDTKHQTGSIMTSEDIRRKIDFLFEEESISPWGSVVVFTGGEPFLQLDEELRNELKGMRRFSLHVETNGTFGEKLNKIDDLKRENFFSSFQHITISPKNTDIDPILLKTSHTLKFLYPFPETFKILDFDRLIEESYKGVAKEYILQPITPRDHLTSGKEEFLENCFKAIEFAKVRLSEKREEWKVIPQIHPIMGIR